MDRPPLDPDAAEALRDALGALGRAGDLVELVSHPGGVARSPHPAPLAETPFAALEGIAGAKRRLRDALAMGSGPPPPV